VSAAPATPSSSLPAWRRVKLGEICSKPQYGWTTKAKQSGTGLKLLRTTDITSGQIDWSTVPFCAESPPDVEKYLVQEGDILISRAGSVGVSHLVTSTESAVFASYLIRFKPGPSVLPKYLAHFLHSPSYWKQIADNTAGIAVPNVNASKLQELELPLAPIDEQRRIVAEVEKQFSRLDEAVANLKRVKDRLVDYKGSIISEAVGGRVTVDEGTAPTGWRRCRLGDAAAKITSGSRDWSPYYGQGASIFLLAQNVRPMSPDFSVVQHVDPPEADPARARSRVQRGDLLVTIVGANTGQACMVGDLPGETFVCQSVALVRPVLAASAPYLNLWLNSPEHGRRYFDRCMYGQGRPHLGFEQLASMPIAMPPPYEQARIVAEVDRRLSIVREVEAEIDANLKRALTLRRGVLARAFAVPSEPGQ
jgi:type I restriction enzyme S subunit